MARTEAQVAELYTPKVRQVLEAFREWVEADDDLSLTRAGRLIGCSGTTVSRLFSHSYPGAVDRYVDAMIRVMARAEKIRAVPSRPGYVDTSVSTEVKRTLELAHLEGVIAVVLGPTGIGKTQGVQAYCRQEPGTVYLEGGVCATSYGILRALSAEVGLDWHGSQYDMRLACCDALRGTGRLVVVDEIDYLKEVPLQVLRMVHDGTAAGMAWIGTEGFLEKLRERKTSTINQVLGRVAYTRTLGALTRDDLELLAEPYGLDREAMDLLEEGSCGQARRAAAALVSARRMNGQQITVKALRKAFRALMPVLRGRNGNGKH